MSIAMGESFGALSSKRGDEPVDDEADAVSRTAGACLAAFRHDAAVNPSYTVIDNDRCGFFLA